MVERGPEKAGVGGSIPSLATILLHNLAKRLERHRSRPPQAPQDVSVVGFDDVQSAAYQNPALTTVRQPLQKMGTLTAEQVLQQIASGQTAVVQQIVVLPELVVRESTGVRYRGMLRPAR